MINQYRAGFEGKFDLQVVEPATGGFYYPDHLTCLGQEGSLPNSGMIGAVVFRNNTMNSGMFIYYIRF